MGVFDLFSKRQERSRGDVPDVYQYETISNELRVQVVHIMRDGFGDVSNHREGPRKAYQFIHETLCHEYGIFTLSGPNKSDVESIFTFLLQTQKIEKTIDVIELSFKILDRVIRGDEHQYEYPGRKISPDDAIAELNYRFREHGVGYQYESGAMIRVDSQLVHSEVVQPALRVLSDPMYKGANAEFMSAHEHYRARKYKECLNDCLKAFESCIKAICAKRGVGLQCQRYRQASGRDRVRARVDPKVHAITLLGPEEHVGGRCSHRSQSPVGTRTGESRSPRSGIHRRILTSPDRIKHSLAGQSRW